MPTASTRPGMRVPAVRMGMAVLCVLLVCVVAVDNVRWEELVQHPRDDLNADEARDKPGHDQKGTLLVTPAGLGEIFGCRGEHAVQCREQLCDGQDETTRAQTETQTMTPKLRLSEHARKALLS